MTASPDNVLSTEHHGSYRLSIDVAIVLAPLGAQHKVITPPSPWQNGKVKPAHYRAQPV